MKPNRFAYHAPGHDRRVRGAAVGARRRREAAGRRAEPRAADEPAAGGAGRAGRPERRRRAVVRPRRGRHARDRRDDAPPHRRDGRRGARAPTRCSRTLASKIGYPAIRVRGTIGGSLSHADPVSELPCVALSRSAREPVHRRRRAAAARCRRASSSTATSRPRCEPGELLVEVRFPHVGGATGLGLRELARKAGDYAVVAVAAAVTVRDGTIVGPRGSGSPASTTGPSRAARRGGGAPGRAGHRGVGRRGGRGHLGPGDGRRRARCVVCQPRRRRARPARPHRRPRAGREQRHDAAHDHAPRSTASRASGEAEPRKLLCDFIREDLGLTGTHVGCEQGVCGACTVLLDGDAGALVPAVRGAGRRRRDRDDRVARRRRRDAASGAGRRSGRSTALQCGFCTPGMLLTAKALLERNPSPTADEVRVALEGNICRCTGYVFIVDSVLHAAELMRRPSMSDVVRHRPAEVLRRAGEAHRGPALPDRPRPLRRRHRAAEHAARGVRAQRASRTPRIDSIDTAAALALEGVHAVVTGADIVDLAPADHVQLDVPVVAADGACGAVGRPGAVRRRGDGRRRRRRPLHRRGRRRPDRGRVHAARGAALGRRRDPPGRDPPARRRGRTTSSSSATSRSASPTGCSTRRTPCSTST